MQDFQDQARKNGVELHDTGACQFCGAYYPKGIFDCMANYNAGLEPLNLNDANHHVSRFLSVDAHALQHPEIHGRWSNHFHLTRLNLILEKKQEWSYSKSPLLSHFLNEYKASRPEEFLLVPEPLQRGKLTAKDLLTATNAEECAELIKKWAEQVYEAWKQNHTLVTNIANGFLAKHSKISR